VTHALTAQQPSSQRFRTGVDLVTVDVVVLDGDGMPVPGLTRADFSILEDGKPQSITEFEAVAVASGASASGIDAERTSTRPPAVSTNVGVPIPAGRSLAIVFDDVNLTRQQGNASRKAIADFIDRGTSPDDTITLVATSGGAWLNARLPRDRGELMSVLGHLEGKYVPDTSAERMSDYEALRLHVFNDAIVEARVRRRYENYRVAGLEPKDPLRRDDMPKIGETRGDVGIIAPFIQSRAEAVYSDAVARNRLTLELLGRAVAALKPARGRKSVILLSKGFVMDTELRGFKDVARAARDANVAIYFVDARGLEATTSQFTAEAIGPTDERDIFQAHAGIALEAAGSVSVAEDSGGFAVHDTNDLAGGLRRIARESRHYYLVGYVSPNTKRDGAFRRIQVRVNRRGVTVRARKGYYAPDDRGIEITRAGFDPDVQRALDAPRETAGVPLRATAFVFDSDSSGAASVMIGAEADITTFAFEPGSVADRRLTDVLELAMAATNRLTGAVYRFGQTIEIGST
jgi:VWFA-related protein